MHSMMVGFISISHLINNNIYILFYK